MFEPPKSCPHAIPTSMGWQDPVTKRIVSPVVRLVERMREEKRRQSAIVDAQKPMQLKQMLVEPVIHESKPMLIEPAPIIYNDTAILLTENEPVSVDDKPSQPKKKKKYKQPEGDVNYE